MKAFTDSKNRTWVVDITVSALRRIKELTSVDLGDFQKYADGSIFEKLSTDPVLLTDVVYAAIRPDLEVKNISKGDFEDAIIGDVLEAMLFAFFEACSDFFPKTQGLLLKEVLRVAKEAMEKGQKEAEKLLAKQPGSLSTNAQPS